VALPSVRVPSGGGAIRGMGEKFDVNAANGTATLSVPIPTTPGRSGFGPTLVLAYDSGNGNGPYGFGWALDVPQVSRRTDKGLPRYGAEPPDVFLLSGAEDLVPARDPAGGWAPVSHTDPAWAPGYQVDAYRPRIEGLYARIERWTRLSDGDVHWRSVTRDNVTTWYGTGAESRIADPADASRVFSWLIARTDDAIGNSCVYTYVPDDGVGVDQGAAHERNRTAEVRGTNRYLKRIQYGNRVSTLVDADLTAPGWMFEVVFDFGDHDDSAPAPAADRPWPVRPDPFSRYRSTFEVRSYRLCRRILMFHHFPQAAEVGADCLVRSVDLGYDASGPAGAFVTSITQCGYRRAGEGYLRRTLPPLEFTYSPATLREEIVEINATDLAGAPGGLSAGYEFVDLDGEGITGILHREPAQTWRYKAGLGGGRFAPGHLLDTAPATGDTIQLLDLGGNGRLDAVAFTGPAPGYRQRTADGGWAPYATFAGLPSIDLTGPDTRFVDLDGDGHVDVLITDDAALTWYPSLAYAGFGPAQRSSTPPDDEAGPRLVFRDDVDAIFLADMSGDGLSDLVRVRNSAVCYWPNLGYGRFGPKVTMDLAPLLDRGEWFDHRRVRLADVDGSGLADLVYLHPDGARIHLNQAGNAFAPAVVIRSFPYVEDVDVVDLLGAGTTALVWSDTRPGEQRSSLRYVDLLGGVKPHLLIAMANNLGARTEVDYASSTSFYLADKAAGTPWLTRLPFPVQVVTRVQTSDLISRDRFVTRYAYRHGYFDPDEREFRGFGLVEQWDSENYATLDPADLAANEDPASTVPPVWTKTWYHTGAFASATTLSRQHESEYWSEPGATVAEREAMLLADSPWPDGIRRPDGSIEAYAPSALELREACRALKGSMLRRETYAIDGLESTHPPYTVAEFSYRVDLLQPKRDGDAHAVCAVSPRETLSWEYDRALFAVPVGAPAALRPDPRIAHVCTLDVDGYGNVLRSVDIAYPRRYPGADIATDPALPGFARDEITSVQATAAATLTVQAYTTPIDTAGAAYRTPLPAQTSRFELIHAVPAGAAVPVRLDDLRDRLATAADLPASDVAHAGATGTGIYRRPIAAARTIYLADDLTGPLPLGTAGARGLRHDTYRLALTADLIAAEFASAAALNPPAAVDAAVLTEGGYVQPDGDGRWWAHAGTLTYAPTGIDTAADQHTFADAHFYRPYRMTDPFGSMSEVGYDVDALLPVRTQDPVGNVVTAALDYRTLQPVLITDANGNQTAVSFDALGYVAGTATLGAAGRLTGDSLTGFTADLSDAQVIATLADPLAGPAAVLGAATTRFVTDVGAFYRTRTEASPSPAGVCRLTRVTHVADPASTAEIHAELSYTDGFGREIQRKLPAEPGPLVDGGPVVARRWITSGATVFNNKDKIVRRFEPSFSATAAFDPAVPAGVSPVHCYDPIGRPVATLHPDDSYGKTVFGPWRQDTYDANDTTLLDPRTDPDVGALLSRVLANRPGFQTWQAARAGGALGPAQQAAAVKTAAHAATPTRVYADPLGRGIVSVAHNRYPDGGSGVDEAIATVTRRDVLGRTLEVLDGLGRTAARAGFDLVGTEIRTDHMDAALRCLVPDIAGTKIRAWSARGTRFRHTFDRLRRPTATFVTPPGAAETCTEQITYGEGVADDAAHNLRTRVYETRDGAGTLVVGDYDVDGNPVRFVRTLPVGYATAPDWSGPVALEGSSFTATSRYDVLKRPVEQTMPDGTVLRPTYNAAGLLERVSGTAGATTTDYLASATYNARGQRLTCAYGNGVTTSSSYDPATFRLTGQRTARGGDTLQDLSYCYDPVGNPVVADDAAQQTLFFRNTVVAAGNDYTYDACYRLVLAAGREHLGQTGPQPTSASDQPRVMRPHPNDGTAMGRYTEAYRYDLVGNVTSVTHRGTDPANPGWTRTYAYTMPSTIDAASTGNRLATTTDGGGPAVAYTYDDHGNLASMPGLSALGWDPYDRLASAACQAPADGGTPRTVFYAYDAGGARTRAVTEDQAAPGHRATERITVGDFEVYRTYRAGTLDVERQTISVRATGRLALLESRTQGTDDGSAALVRYQLCDPLGSALLELDPAAAIISYEEYYPYGDTSYQGVRAATETPKRFRFTGAERDADTGFYYLSARYYAPWLCRWLSPDPAGLVDGVNGYTYAKANPVRYRDPSGLDDQDRHSAPTTGTPVNAPTGTTAPTTTQPGGQQTAPTPPPAGGNTGSTTAGSSGAATGGTPTGASAAPTAANLGSPAPPFATIAQSNARLVITTPDGHRYALLDHDLAFIGNFAYGHGGTTLLAGPGNLVSARVGLPFLPAFAVGAYASVADDLHTGRDNMSSAEGVTVQATTDPANTHSVGFFATGGSTQGGGNPVGFNGTATGIWQISPRDSGGQNAGPHQVDINLNVGGGSNGSLSDGTSIPGYVSVGGAGSYQYNNFWSVEAGGGYTGVVGATPPGTPSGETRFFVGTGFQGAGYRVTDHAPALVIANIDFFAAVPNGGTGPGSKPTFGVTFTFTIAGRTPFGFTPSPPPPTGSGQ
jgi:RHS repeat-associated protein